MVFLLSDYRNSFYTSQVIAKIKSLDNSIDVVDAVSDLPQFNVKASAYLIAAYIEQLPTNCVVIGVVDPGVGSDRLTIAFKKNLRWFIGPDNGLFTRILAAGSGKKIPIKRVEQNENISKTFHGRDVFAPAAVKLMQSDPSWPVISNCDCITMRMLDQWDRNLFQVIYIDSFGNGITGVSEHTVSSDNVVLVSGFELRHANTFSEVDKGYGMWYINSIGLLEVAVNQGSAANQFQLKIGDPIAVL